MTKRARSILTHALLMTSVACASGSTFAQTVTPRADRQEQRTRLRAEIKKQIAKFKNGEYLYQHVDFFQRNIDRMAAEAIGYQAESDASEQFMAPLADTSHVLDVSKTSSDENETSIAVNRANTNIIVAGANDATMYSRSMPAYVSTDAGTTWKTYRLPAVNYQQCVAGGDPILASSSTGDLYYAFLIYTMDMTVSDLIVAHSTNGKVWTLGKPVVGNSDLTSGVFEDKETIAVDNDSTSPYFGRVYIAWIHYGENEMTSGLQIAYSDNKGINWSKPVLISTSYAYFPLVRVGKGGKVFVAASTTGGSDAESHAIFVSSNGGNSFVNRRLADFADYPQSMETGRSSLKGDAGFRSFPYATFDVDLKTDELYAVYGTYDYDYSAAWLYAVRSTNEGVTWSEPKRVSSPSADASDHFLPWVSYDQVKGTPYISFYSSEEDVANIESRFVRTTFDSVESVGPLSKNLFDPTSLVAGGEPFLGDYIGTDAHAGVFAAAWTENRPLHSDGDVYAFVSSPALPPISRVHQINATNLQISEGYPNPAIERAKFSITASADLLITADLFDQAGRKVKTASLHILPDQNTDLILDLHGLSSGAYHCVITDGDVTTTRQIVVAR